MWLRHTAAAARRAPAGTTVPVMAATMASRTIGFLIPFFIVNWYGVSARTDAFFFVYGSAAFFIVILSDLIEAILVPVFAEAAAAAGRRAAAIIAARAMRLAAVATVVCYLVGLAGLHLVSARGLGASQFDWPLAFQMYGWAAPMLLLAVLASVPSAAMLADGRFFIPVLGPGLRGLVTLAVMFLARRSDAGAVLVLAYTAGEAARFSLVAGAARRSGLAFVGGEPADLSRIRSPQALVVLLQALALVTTGINPLISRYAATHLAQGSVTLVEVGEKLFWVPMTLFYAAISTVGLSRWANAYHREGMASARHRIGGALATTGVAALACSALLVAAGGPLARLFLSRAVVAALGTPHLTAVVRLYAAGILPFALLMVVQRSLLVLRESRVLLLAGAAGSVANVAMLTALTPVLQVQGIALATSLTHVVSLAVAAILAYRLWHPAEPGTAP